MPPFKFPAGVVIVSRPGCAPCETLKNMLENMGVKFKVVDAEKEKLPIVNVPQLYVDGTYQFTGVPNTFAVKKAVRK